MKVKVGLSTIVGYSLMASGLLPVLLKVVQEGQNIDLNGPEAAFALAGVILGGITAVGRYLQAHAALGAGELAQLSAEARANALTVPPDGVDAPPAK